jgi:hypothetical protein
MWVGNDVTFSYVYCHHLSHRWSRQVSRDQWQFLSASEGRSITAGATNEFSHGVDKECGWLLPTNFFLVGREIMSILWLLQISVIYRLFYFWATLLSWTDNYVILRCYGGLYTTDSFVLMISMIVRYATYLWEGLLIRWINLNSILLCEAFQW